MPDNNTVTSLKGESWVNEKLAEDICTNPDNDFRRSFPSGHASQVRLLHRRDSFTGEIASQVR